VLALLIAAAAVDTVICRRLSCCNYAGSASPLVAPLIAAPLFAQLLLQFLSPESLVLLLFSALFCDRHHQYVCLPVLSFVVVNLDASMVVRKPLFKGFSSSPHYASLQSCSV
jgi:hypothetical protein